jgi:hypothetical protein
MRKVRAIIEDEAFACQDVKDGIWNDRIHATILSYCRVDAAGRWSERTWEVAFFPRDAKLREFLMRESLKDQPAKWLGGVVGVSPELMYYFRPTASTWETTVTRRRLAVSFSSFAPAGRCPGPA